MGQSRGCLTECLRSSGVVHGKEGKFPSFYANFGLSGKYAACWKKFQLQHRMFDRQSVIKSYRLYDRSYFVTGQKRPVMTG